MIISVCMPLEQERFVRSGDRHIIPLVPKRDYPGPLPTGLITHIEVTAAAGERMSECSECLDWFWEAIAPLAKAHGLEVEYLHDDL